jgi:hypothetical protein
LVVIAVVVAMVYAAAAHRHALRQAPLVAAHVALAPRAALDVRLGTPVHLAPVQLAVPPAALAAIGELAAAALLAARVRLAVLAVRDRLRLAAERLARHCGERCPG